MTRRMIVVLTALLGVLGVIIVSASMASAQVRLPIVFDFGALFERLFAAFPPFLKSIVSPIFGRLLQAFTGSCAPFCAS
jgi:hypothetical protein